MICPDKSKSSSPEVVIPFTTEVKASKFMLFAVTLADPTIVVRAFELNTVVVPPVMFRFPLIFVMLEIDILSARGAFIESELV